MDAIDNRVEHARYLRRPQPHSDEDNVEVLQDHVQQLATELAGLTRRRRGVTLRTQTHPYALHAQIERLNEALADVYIAMAKRPAGDHSAACAVNQAPVYRPGPCNCERP